MKKLFVYGTLLEGFGNWQWALYGKAKLLGKTKISGNFTMVSLGGFPGVIPEGNTDIYGEVYEVNDQVYKDIEHLEDYPHFYDKMEVDTAHGKAEMYILPQKYLNYPKVESGNWKEHEILWSTI